MRAVVPYCTVQALEIESQLPTRVDSFDISKRKKFRWSLRRNCRYTGIRLEHVLPSVRSNFADSKNWRPGEIFISFVVQNAVASRLFSLMPLCERAR